MDNSFEIKFDYRFDNNGFFDDPSRRESLEKAAEVWKNLIQEDLPHVPSGIEFSVTSPVDGRLTPITLSEPIDDLLIFVGAESSPFSGSASLPHGKTCSCRLCCPPWSQPLKSSPQVTEIQVAPLAQAIVTGSNAVGTVFDNRLNGSDFTPWAGSISFNDSPTFSDGSPAEWFFDTTPEPNESIPDNSIDFFSTALHEIGHVLGIGTASIFDELGAGGNFRGENALAVTEQEGVPLTSDLSHVDSSFTTEEGSALMQPRIAGRTFPTEIDQAILADIGWEIEGFTAQGEIPPLASSEDDTIRGTILSDVIRGFEGNDTIRGERERDILWGGLGEDELSGGEGNDYLLGGEDADLVIGEEGNDVLLGNEGSNQLQGRMGNDVLFGGDKGEGVFGGDGNDWLAGGGGNDELQGGEGRDRMIGGAGNDSLFGQEETDTFVFNFGSGRDRINDFEFSSEVIAISAEYGLTAEEVFETLTKPFSIISQITLSDQDVIEIAHEAMEGSPLTLDNLKIIAPSQQGIKTGSLGEDTLDITGSDNLWFSGAGNDVINFSTFTENQSSHRIYGGQGDDIIFANQGNRLFGSTGDDFLNASLGRGDNRLYGGEGNDWLMGKNNDILSGGMGNDLLQAGSNNILSGGEGADQFIFGFEEKLAGENLILDFNVEEDQIAVANLTFEDLTLTQEDNATIIATEQGTLAELLNIEVNQLTEAQFFSTNALPLSI